MSVVFKNFLSMQMNVGISVKTKIIYYFPNGLWLLRRCFYKQITKRGNLFDASTLKNNRLRFIQK